MGANVSLTMIGVSVACSVGLLVPAAARAQDPPGASAALTTSPFKPPKANDHTFILNAGTGLDTGCTYRSGGPLVITVPIKRVLGVLATLKQQRLVPATVRVEFPAYDVDSSGGSGSVPNERDRVSFNGKQLGFMTGLNNTWVMQRFDVSIDDLKLPADPGPGKTVTAASNAIQIDIDTASTPPAQNWCTAVDWISISIENPVPPRPWIGVHGIFSSSAIWDALWVPQVQQRGIPAYRGPDMGNLDSIQSNAAKVGVEVQAALNRWGVDRVNVVAHSKGGLDTRHYAEANDKIENLVQLGTPNAGSPLADAIESGTIAGLGLGVNIAANLLAGGVGGYQLTTPYMKRYNSLHGSNPQTRYLAIAGSYTPGTGLSDPLKRSLIAIVGQGDMIVPVSSVHALPYTTNDIVPSTYPDDKSLHTVMHGKLDFFDRALSRVLSAGSPMIEELEIGQAPASGPELQRTASKSGRLTPGQAQDHTLAVDSAASVSFTMFASDGNLAFSLINPSGVTVQPTTPGVGFEKLQIPGGWVFSYSFTPPAAGIWTARVQNTSSASIDYSIAAWLSDGSVTMTPTVPSTLALNAPITIRAALLRSGAALTGATVQAFVKTPANAALPVTLLDNGLSPDTTANDGVYNGNFTSTATAGSYEIAIQAASPAAATQPFSREAYAQATVSASTSKLLANITDFGKDTDGNGRYEQLVVRVPVQISTSRTYRWSGTLRDSAGNEQRASSSASLTTSTTSIDLPFDGSTLLSRGVNGPYTLTAFSLAEEVSNDVLPVADLTTPYQTTAYVVSKFEGPNIVVSGTAAAQGVDTNGNGKFDLLRATIGLAKQTAGSYSWSARLRDLTGVEIALAAGQGTLPAGTSNIQIDFDGPTIGKFGADGPYDVTDLLVIGPDGTLTVANVLRTAALTGSQFEGYIAPTAPPVFSPVAGSFANLVQVTMSSATSGATIRYTTDGTDPTSSSTLYSTAVSFTKTTTVKARAFSTGLKDSTIASGVFTVVPTALKLGRTQLAFAAVKAGAALGAVTPAQEVTVAFDGVASSWTASSSQPWLQIASATGSGNGSFLVSIANPGNVLDGSTAAAATITITPSNASIAAKTVAVGLAVRQSGAGAAPFGAFDTPAGDSTVLAGSVSFTGWALDDLGVKRVEIWRNLQPGETTVPFAAAPGDPRNGKVFVADATFVSGARPDVEGIHPTVPFNYRAGWGYLLLTWGLWNQGIGTYTLFAYAVDVEDNLATLGAKTIIVNNGTATKPFGSIDTPTIGGNASGPNFGWGLTPKVNGAATCKIQSNGVQVSIDSGPLQPVVYGNARTDIAGAFPGFSNSASAGGYFIFDWSTLTNGAHTIGWLITDDCNRADGVGSRFFNVTTGTNLSTAPAIARAPAAAHMAETESPAPITVAHGYGELPAIVGPGEGGSRTVEVKLGERIEVRVPPGFGSAYQVVTGGQRDLPVGSTWDAASGTFYWQPAPGFLGRFRIVFSNGRERISVRIVVVP